MASWQEIASGLREIFRTDIGVVSQKEVDVVQKNRENGDAGGLSGSMDLISDWREMTAPKKSRKDRYDEYDEMDGYSEVSVCLDTYADEVTQPHPLTKQVIWVEGENVDQVDAVETLLFDVLHVEDVIWSIARATAKYGDEFDRLFCVKDKGVEWWDESPNRSDITPQKDKRGGLQGYELKEKEREYFLAHIRDPSENGGGVGGSSSGSHSHGVFVCRPWEYVHFKNLGRDRSAGLGTSMLHAARDVWKQLKMLEDAVAVYRLMRAPDRLIWNIDVGEDVSPYEALEIVQRYQREMKKITQLDVNYHNYDVQTRGGTVDTDIFMPRKPGSDTGIERLDGGADIHSLVDVEMMLNKFYRAMRIPRDYVGGEGFSGDYRIPLSTQDLRVARFCRRLQQAIMMGFMDVAQLHLAFKGLDVSAETFGIQMYRVITRDEERTVEMIENRLNQASEYADILDTLEVDVEKIREYVLSQILGLSAEDLKHFGVTMASGDMVQVATQVSSLRRSEKTALGLIIEDIAKDVYGDDVGF